MGRQRLLSPAAPSSETLGHCSPLARLLFLYGTTIADREGRLRYVPRALHGQLLPYDAGADVEALVEELVDAGCLHLYTDDEGRRYLAYPGWQRHQRPHNKESASQLPAPPGPNPGRAAEKPGPNPGRAAEKPGPNPGRAGASGDAQRAREKPGLSPAQGKAEPALSGSRSRSRSGSSSPLPPSPSSVAPPDPPGLRPGPGCEEEEEQDDPEQLGSIFGRLDGGPSWDWHGAWLAMGGRGVSPPADQLPRWLGLREFADASPEGLARVLELRAKAAGKRDPLAWFLSCIGPDGVPLPRPATPSNGASAARLRRRVTRLRGKQLDDEGGIVVDLDSRRWDPPLHSPAGSDEEWARLQDTVEDVDDWIERHVDTGAGAA